MSNMNQNEPPFQYNALCKTDVLESELFTFVWVISKFSSLTEEQGEEMRSRLSLMLTESISNTTNPVSPLCHGPANHVIRSFNLLAFCSRTNIDTKTRRQTVQKVLLTLIEIVENV